MWIYITGFLQTPQTTIPSQTPFSIRNKIVVVGELQINITMAKPWGPNLFINWSGRVHNNIVICQRNWLLSNNASIGTKDKRSFRTSGEHPSVITDLVLNEIQSKNVWWSRCGLQENTAMTDVTASFREWFSRVFIQCSLIFSSARNHNTPSSLRQTQHEKQAEGHGFMYLVKAIIAQLTLFALSKDECLVLLKNWVCSCVKDGG